MLRPTELRSSVGEEKEKVFSLKQGQKDKNREKRV